MKQFLCLCLSLLFIFSALPSVALATDSDSEPLTDIAPDTESGSGFFTHEDQPSEANLLALADFSGPELKSGRYRLWIDRVASLPEYARTFYKWLANNSGAQGALVKPELATQSNGKYYHQVTVYTKTFQVPANASNYKAVADQSARNEANSAFDTISGYLGAMYDAFDRDHPEVFWLSGEAQFGYDCKYQFSSPNSGKITVRINMPIFFYLKKSDFDIRYKAYRSASAIAADITKRDQAVASIIAQCPTTSVAEQVRYLNRTLVKRNAYNSTIATGSPDGVKDAAWECLNALVGSTGVNGPACEGYARAFMVLCRQLGIPCVLVDGAAKTTASETGKAHMWNYVKVDNQWYAVDVTWNDPFNKSKPTDKVSGHESEKWLLLGSGTEVASKLSFINSHPVQNKSSNNGLMFTNGPALSTTAYQSGQVTNKIRVSLKNPGSTSAAVNLALYLPGSKVPIAKKSVTGSQVDYTFTGLTAGNYRLVISKSGYATMDRTVSTKTSINNPGTLTAMGDISGDGKLNIADVAKLYAIVRGVGAITDSYHVRVADMNSDGKVTVADVAKLYTKVKG